MLNTKNILSKSVILAGQLPLVYLVQQHPDWIKNYPKDAIILFLGYEILLFLLGFGRKIWKIVWTDNLEKEIVEASAGWVLNSVRTYFSGFRKRYNKRLYFDNRFFNMKGLRTQGTFTLELDKVFVDLKITPATKNSPINFKLLEQRKLNNSRPVWDFLRIYLKNKDNYGTYFAMIGSPGCGKTTLLQHIALVFANNKQKSVRLPPLTPVFLYLRNHIDEICNNGDNLSLSQVAHNYFSKESIFNELNPPKNWFENQLIKGKCIILLDGLDEVAKLEQRIKVSEWVSNQIKIYAKCPFIITSRPHGYYSAPLSGVHILEVQPFHQDQVKKFVHSWYREVEIFSTGKNDAGIHNLAENNANDLLNRLQELPALSKLTVNPLLLTMISIVHRYRGQLPGRRVELYSEICDVLLGHWRSAKGIANTITAAQARVVLQPLAAEMMHRHVRQISIKDASNIIKPFLKTINQRVNNAEEFLLQVQESSGLVHESELKEWSFAHLSFQEYLAASDFHGNKKDLDFSSIVNDSWWHETLRLYAAQGDATELVKSCSNHDDIIALSLAVDCLEEALQIEEETRTLIISMIVDNLDSEDKQKQILSAKVYLKRNTLKHYQLNENIYILQNAISNVEYQLFLNYKEKQGEYRQPDHWLHCGFNKGEGKNPVSGLRPQDTIEYCAWLSLEDDDRYKYRLPYLDEILEYSKIKSDDSSIYWCIDEDEIKLTPSSHIYNNLPRYIEINLNKSKNDWITFKIRIPIEACLSNNRAKAIEAYESIIENFSEQLAIDIKNNIGASDSKEKVRVISSVLNRNNYADIDFGEKIRSHFFFDKEEHEVESIRLSQGLPFGLYHALIEDHESTNKKKLDSIREHTLSLDHIAHNAITIAIENFLEISHEHLSKAEQQNTKDKKHDPNTTDEKIKERFKYKMKSLISTYIDAYHLSELLISVFISENNTQYKLRVAMHNILIEIIFFIMQSKEDESINIMKVLKRDNIDQKLMPVLFWLITSTKTQYNKYIFDRLLLVKEKYNN